MFVRSLLIENFRAIQHVELSFQRQVTVLIGENGCGKSSILNALEAVLGRNVPKDGFSIRASDFHRYAFGDSLSETLDDPQATDMRIVIGFGGSYAGTKRKGEQDGDFETPGAFGTDRRAPGTDEILELGRSQGRILRADEASEYYKKSNSQGYRSSVSSSQGMADAAGSGGGWGKIQDSSAGDPSSGGALPEDGFGCLHRFCTDDFMVNLELRGGRLVRVFSFYLCVEAKRCDNQVKVDYRFENERHEPIKLDNPLDYLKTIKTVCPLLRIRPGALLPPIKDGQEGMAAQDNVDSLFRQAYSELTEDSRYSARDFIATHREQLETSLNELEQILVHNADDESSELDSDIYTAISDRDNAATGKHEQEREDRYTRTLQEGEQPDLALIEERLSAPLSTLNPLFNKGERSESRRRDYDRFSALLRGTGARSLAMLAFADSFFKAQASTGSGDGESPNCDYYPLLSVENPEDDLHPLMLTSVWSLIDRMSPQRLLSTNSSDLLSAVPLTGMRRIVRSADGLAKIYQVHSGHIHINDLRRIAYHLRIRRGTALFMRFWLLVEGETECWLLPEVARAMGYDLWGEGVEFVEFAQCGLTPLVNLANELGISWHLLADGDKAGHTYGKLAAPHAKSRGLGRVTVLKQLDIENCFWENGYEHVFRMIAGPAQKGTKKAEKSKDVIKRAIRIASKPGLALALGRAMQAAGTEGIPAQLRDMIYDAVRTARRQGRG